MKPADELLAHAREATHGGGGLTLATARRAPLNRGNAGRGEGRGDFHTDTNAL